MQHQISIAAIKKLTRNVKSFELDCGPSKFIYYPGQWIDIHRTINDESHNCGYSITSIPSASNNIEVAVKLAPDLLLTRYFHEECKIGDRLYISDAQGDIWINDNINGSYVFIGGGVGITPLYSMIQQIMATRPDTPVTLLYSITSPEEFLFEREIRQFAEEHSNFKFYVTVTREKNHQLDFSGRITARTLQSIKPPSNASYYLCGPPPMVDAVADSLVQLKSELKLDPKKIFYDKWWS